MIEEIKKYVRLQVELLKLSLAEKTSLVIGKICLMAIVGIFLMVLGLLLLVLIYTVLLNFIGIPWLVALIEIGITLIFLLIIWVFRQKLIIQPIANMIIKELYDDDDKKEKEERDE